MTGIRAKSAPDADSREYDSRGWAYDPATQEVYDLADPTRRRAHGWQFYWQGEAV